MSFDLTPRQTQRALDELVVHRMLDATPDQRYESLLRLIDLKEVERALNAAGWDLIPSKT